MNENNPTAGMDEETICAECGDDYSLRNMEEPTKYCDHCAHKLLEQYEEAEHEAMQQSSQQREAGEGSIEELLDELLKAQSYYQAGCCNRASEKTIRADYETVKSKKENLLREIGKLAKKRAASPTIPPQAESARQGEVAEPDEPSEIEACIACLGDDAATLRGAEFAPEIADNMDLAASLLSRASPLPAPKAMMSDAEPVLPCMLTVGGGRFHAGVAVSTAQGAIDRLYARLRELEPPISDEDRARWKEMTGIDVPPHPSAARADLSDADAIEAYRKANCQTPATVPEKHLAGLRAVIAADRQRQGE